MKRKSLLLNVVLGIFMPLSAQIIEVDPTYPTVDDSAYVTLHVNRCNCSLEGYTGDIYAHTGLITSESTSWSDWQYVIASWSTNLEKALLEKLDDTTYVLHITPSIMDYYGITPEVDVNYLAFVFRNPQGTLQTSPDIFYEVYEAGLNIKINEPEGNLVVKQGDTITVSATAIAFETNEPDSMTLYIDDTVEYISYADTLYYEFEVTNTGKHWIKIEAMNDELTSSDSLYYFVRNEIPVADLPDGVKDGINYIDSATVTLVLYAPYKDNIIAIGDFNNWDLSNDYLMNRTPDSSRYWLTISDLIPGEEYAFQYLIDGNLRIADPYTDKILDPVNDQYIPETTYPDLKPYPEGYTSGITAVLQTDQVSYTWENTDFTPPSVTDLVIYELLVRDFTEARTFNAILDTLNYLLSLGVNAIELMPVSEFEGNDSWGYNPSFYFAVDKYYGTKNDYKKFIDECHKRGIAVLMDIVLNHSYGQSPMVQMYFDSETGKPSAENPWYNQDCPHQPWCWGYDFNHESQATKTFVYRVNSYWLEEYHVDGFRFDFTKGFTNHAGDGWAYDASRIAILKEMYDSIKTVNENAFVIFEHLTENTEETELANYGILLWGKMTDPYNEATMGYHDGGKSDLSGISYQNRGWDDPHLVGYMESHDEQRLMYKNLTWGNSLGDYDVKDLNTGLSRVETAAAFFFTVPGPKMVWQFGELGYDISIDDPCRVCAKPVLWEYYDNYHRYRLYKVFSALIRLRIEEDLFETSDFSLLVSGALKRINLNSASMNAVIVGNFALITSTIEGNFPHTGTWYEYFTGTTLEVTSTSQSIELRAGEYRLYTDIQLELPDIPLLESNAIALDAMNGIFFPNPTSGTIYFTPVFSGKMEVSLYNLQGKPVYKNNLIATPGETITLNLNNTNQGLEKGLYLYTIISPAKTLQGKLCVE